MTAQERLLEWCESLSERFEEAFDSAVRQAHTKEAQTGWVPENKVVSSFDVNLLELVKLARAYRLEKLIQPVVETHERHIEIAEARRRA